MEVTLLGLAGNPRGVTPEVTPEVTPLGLAGDPWGMICAPISELPRASIWIGDNGLVSVDPDVGSALEDRFEPTTALIEPTTAREDRFEPKPADVCLLGLRGLLGLLGLLGLPTNDDDETDAGDREMRMADEPAAAAATGGWGRCSSREQRSIVGGRVLAAERPPERANSPRASARWKKPRPTP